MAAAPMIMMGVGAAVSAVGAIRSGQAAKAAGDYNAQIDEQNAQLSIDQSQEEARRQDIVAAQKYGSIQANFGASGLTGGTGVEVLGQAAANAELDHLTILHGGQIKAKAYGNDAALQRSQGYYAQQSGYIGAASSLLSGGSTAAYYGSGAGNRIGGDT